MYWDRRFWVRNWASELLKNATPTAWLRGLFRQSHCGRKPNIARTMPFVTSGLCGTWPTSLFLTIIYKMTVENRHAQHYGDRRAPVLAGGSKRTSCGKWTSREFQYVAVEVKR